MWNVVVIGQTFAEIWRFLDFSKWRSLPSCIFKIAIFDFWNVEILTVRTVTSVKGVKLHHCAKFCGDQSNRCWDIAIFFKMAAATILDFWNVEILTVRMVKGVKLHHHVKFCGNWSKHCEIWRFSIVSGWRPSAILDLWCATTKVISWSLSLCKIWLESIHKYTIQPTIWSKLVFLNCG